MDFLLVHRKNKKAFSHPDTAILWSTCLRQLLFLNQETFNQITLDPEDEVFEVSDAYKLCLEICCGLHSPILGETEVFGQFRDFSFRLRQRSPLEKFLKKFCEQVIADTKQVRHEHLLNLGAQSYGSLLRRYCQEATSLTILGAGQLAEELLPWFTGKTIQVVARRREQAQQLKTHFPEISIHSMGEQLPRTCVLIVAAPIPSIEFSRWRETQFPPPLVVDLRGEGAVDPLPIAKNLLVTLQELFQSMERQREVQDQRSERAKERITKLTERFSHALKTRAEHRPFGWEDFCA